MKILVSLLLLVFTGWGCVAQPSSPPPLDPQQRITYSALIPVKRAKQAELLARAQQWAAGGTVPSQIGPNLGMFASVPGQLTVQGLQDLTYLAAGKPTTVQLGYVAEVATRDGEYGYALTNFVFILPSAMRVTPVEQVFAAEQPADVATAALRTGFEQAAAALVAGLQCTMRKPLHLPAKR